MKSNFLGLNPRNDTTYVCKGCGRDVDAELEVSPGEPDECRDCWEHRIAWEGGEVEVPC
jgi:DNA-directed RNA polymerase subunit RPC12/RpoP